MIWWWIEVNTHFIHPFKMSRFCVHAKLKISSFTIFLEFTSKIRSKRRFLIFRCIFLILWLISVLGHSDLDIDFWKLNFWIGASKNKLWYHNLFARTSTHKLKTSYLTKVQNSAFFALTVPTVYFILSILQNFGNPIVESCSELQKWKRQRNTV